MTKNEELPERIEGILEKLKGAEREIAAFRSKEALGQIDQLFAAKTRSGKVDTVLAKVVGELGNDEMRALAGALIGRFSGAPVAIALFSGGKKPIVVAQTSQEARNLGVKAGEMVKRASKVLGGGGGGKDDFAQGGGTDPTAIPVAIKELESYLTAIG